MKEEKPKEAVPEAGENVMLSKEEHQHLLEQAKELGNLRDQFLRRAADYDNARKRLAKEREEFIKFSQERLVRDLLPVLDNFERALSHAVESSSDSSNSSKGLTAGLQLILKQLLSVLSSHGLKRFESQGTVFDPHLHEAVDQVEGEGPEGEILEEILPGYLLNERVIRPARVKIRAGTKKAGGEEEKEEEIT